MGRKKTLEQIKKLEFVRMTELAEVNKIRYATVKYYWEQGLLPYKQDGIRLSRYYPRIEASEQIQKILKLKKQRKSIKEIVALLKIK